MPGERKEPPEIAAEEDAPIPGPAPQHAEPRIPVPPEPTDPPPSAALQDPPGAVVGLFRARLFIGLFQHLADMQHSAELPPSLRVQKLRESDGWLYWLCVMLDLAVGVIAVALTLIVAVLAGIKLLYPVGW